MNQNPPPEDKKYAFLAGGGEMGHLTRSFNWAETKLGEPDQWPQSLKTLLNIILKSRFPMFLWWGPDLLCFYNDAYRPSLGLNGKHPSILGMPAAQAWIEIWDTIKPLIDQVLTGGEATWSEDQLIPIFRNGRIEDVYWTFSYSPVADESGTPAGVLVICSETTAKVLASQALQEKNKRLQQSIEAEKLAQKRLRENENSLRLIIQQAPVSIAIFRGADYLVEIVNSRALELWGRKERDVLNKPILEVMSELESQGIKKLLDQVYNTGETFAASELPVQLLRDGQLETAYIDFVYDALRDSDSVINGIITIGFEVTGRVLTRKALQQSEAEQSALNEELFASNEELQVTNEELAEAQEKLQKILVALTASESNLRNMILQAPVAIGLFTGESMVLETINDKFLQLWDRDHSIIGKALLEALPELEHQPYLQIMQEVLRTGETYYGNESLVVLTRHGTDDMGYYNFINQAFRDNEGKITGVIVVANEVTEQVNARMEVQRAEEMMRFSVEAAKAATWFMDVETGRFVTSARLKEMFGFMESTDISYQDILTRIPEEYRERVVTEVQQSVAKGESYSVEHPVVIDDSGKKRWVRALGKLYPASGNRGAHFSGMIIDITEQKEDELRKNDFIGMVSHELKTPLTSLSAYIQLLLAKSLNADDAFTAGALEKANTQVKKMTNMINGFLNVSRLESGKIILYKESFEMNELLQEMIAETELILSKETINFLPCPTVSVVADRDKIGSVISNLLSNAVKYSAKGKPISVVCKAGGGEVTVSVTDEGIGIKPYDIERLFDRFYRVENNSTAHIAGFGIGLYLSAEIIERHGGKIWAESETGKGSTFHFTVPLQNPD